MNVLPENVPSNPPHHEDGDDKVQGLIIDFVQDGKLFSFGFSGTPSMCHSLNKALSADRSALSEMGVEDAQCYAYSSTPGSLLALMETPDLKCCLQADDEEDETITRLWVLAKKVDEEVKALSETRAESWTINFVWSESNAFSQCVLVAPDSAAFPEWNDCFQEAMDALGFADDLDVFQPQPFTQDATKALTDMLAHLKESTIGFDYSHCPAVYALWSSLTTQESLQVSLLDIPALQKRRPSL